MNSRYIILGRNEPNQAQLKLFATTCADLAKAILLASGAVLFVPASENTNVLLAIIGFLLSLGFMIAASRFLKEVKDP